MKAQIPMALSSRLSTEQPLVWKSRQLLWKALLHEGDSQHCPEQPVLGLGAAAGKQECSAQLQQPRAALTALAARLGSAHTDPPSYSWDGLGLNSL